MAIVISIAQDSMIAAIMRTQRERPWADHVHFDGSWCPSCMPPRRIIRLRRTAAGTPILPADDAPPGYCYG